MNKTGLARCERSVITVTEDLRTELHESVDQVVTDKEREQAENERIASLETRLSAAETRETPGVDLSPIHSAINDLSTRFDTLLASIVASRASGSTETGASVDTDTSDDDDVETAPRVVTQMTHKSEIDEKPPRAAHFLFRRFGGR